MTRWIILASSLVVLAGCQVTEPEASKESSPTPTTDAPVGSAKTPPMMDVKENPEETKQLASLQKEYEDSKAAYEQKKDDKTKETFVKSTVAYANATMTAESLAPKEKYPAALALYREALKHDPKNKSASESKQLIEDIYKSMGRPVPE